MAALSEYSVSRAPAIKEGDEKAFYSWFTADRMALAKWIAETIEVEAEEALFSRSKKGRLARIHEMACYLESLLNPADADAAARVRRNLVGKAH